MKKSIKRTLSLLLALTMVLSLGLPAYAVGVSEDDIAITEEPAVKTANLPIGAGKQPGIIEEDEIITDDLIVDIVDEESVVEEQAAPAKDFSYNESATGFSVEVSAPVGALPLGTEMVVDRLVDLSAVQAAVDASENLSGEVRLAADISFWHEGKEIEPAEGTKLLVRMSAPEIEGIADPIIVHIPDGENAVPEIVEQVKPDEDIVMVNTIEFEADSFSTFAVVWDSGTASNTTTNLRFRSNGTNRITATIHYVDTNGTAITRPSSINGNTDVSVGYPGTTVTFSTDLGKDISGYTYQGAFRNANLTTPVTSILGERYSQNYTNYNEYTIYNGDTEVANNRSTGNNLNAGDVYLVYKNNNPSSGNKVTVHYVDTEGHELTVKNSTFPTTLNSSSNSPALLIYDIDGYTYSKTYYSATEQTTPGGTSISPYILRGDNGQWYYPNASQYMANNAHIYVVYTKMDDPVQGGTATIDPDNEVWPDEEDPARVPTFGKSSTSNGDGTNTIALTITGPEKAIENKTKANVIVVFDVSGSMCDNMAGTGSYTARQAQNMDHSSRMWIAANAVNNMANTLLAKTDSQGNKLVQMALIKFSTNAEQVRGFTDSYGSFSSDVWKLTPDGGTNWEKGLQLANRMKNTDEDFADAPTFIVFVTDGDPTFRVSRMDATDADLISEGQGAYTSDFIFGAGGSDSKGYNLQAAQGEVSSIITHNKSFYAIGVSDSVTKVRTLVTGGGGKAENAILASSESALNKAFEDIAGAISASLGFGDVSLNDGITDLANVDMKVMHEVDPDSFTYYRFGGEGNKYGADFDHKTVWTQAEMAAEKCGLASYDNATGAVQWNMGPDFQMENNVTYVVTFRVWASEEALELVADVNNGIIRDENGEVDHVGTPAEAYAALTDEQKAQIVEVKDTNPQQYALKTNTDEVYATYKRTTKTGEVVSISDPTTVTIEPSYGTIQNLDLPSMQLSIKKLWDDDLTGGEDRDNSVTLILKSRVTGEGEYQPYKVPQSNGDVSENIVLNDSNNWTFTLYVAPGIKAGNDILEKGFEFTLSESNLDYHYELNEEAINPMLVDGVPTYLGDGDHNQSLSAVNAVKGGIDIRKIVTDAEGNEIQTDEEFTIKGYILDPDGHPYTFDQSWDKRTDKSKGLTAGQDPDWDAHQNDTGAFHKIGQDGKRIIYKGHFDSTAEITLTLKVGEYYRFVNVPQDCTYCFYEVDENGNPIDGAEIPVGFEFDRIDGLNQQRYPAPKDDNGDPIYDDHGNIVLGDFHPLPTDQQPTYDEATRKLTGQVYANTQHNVNVVNKSVLHDDFFYVYHSSDNTVEKIYADDTRVIKTVDDATGNISYTFNIATETKAGYIYGGYYQSYNGNVVTVEGDGALPFEVKPYSFKTALAYVTDPNLGGTWADDDAGQPYMGDGEWWANDTAYTDNGMAFEPEMNTVYYLKEVPDAYMRGAVRYTYYEDANKMIGTVWIVTAVDANDYNEFGIVYNFNSADGTGTTEQGDFTQKMTIVPINKPANASAEFGADTLLSHIDSTYTKGYVGYVKIRDMKITGEGNKGLFGDNVRSAMYWVTPDNIRVTGVREIEVNGISLKGTIAFVKLDCKSTLTDLNETPAP